MITPYQSHPDDWPTQTLAVHESVRLMNEGVRSMCITSPTGGGKSRIVQRGCEHFVENEMTVVVMSNRILLTMQLLRSLSAAGIRCGCRAAGFEAWSDVSAPVQVISGQTEIARVLKRRKRTGEGALHHADVVFVDEFHLQGGDKSVEILNEYKEKHSATIIGITATPLGVSHMADELIVAGNNSQLRQCGALVHAKCFEPAVVDLAKVRRTKTGLFSQTELEDEMKSVWTQHIVARVFDSWKSFNPDARPSLGMAPGVKESLGLAMEYWKRGVNAAHIDAEGIFVNGEYKRTNEQSDRDELFEMAKDGRVPQIWNRFVLREAIDLPWLYMLSIATPVASVLSYVQIVGRVLRAAPGKEHALIADHCGAIRMHGSPNMDRDKDWRQYFHSEPEKITKDRFERLTSPSHKEPEPITCPKCQMIRKTGAECPNCKFAHPKSIRMVIQEDGKLKESSGDVYKRRVVREFNDTLQKYQACYMQKKRSKKPQTFNQLLGWFFHEHHYYPPDTMPGLPKKRSDFDRKMQDVPSGECNPWPGRSEQDHRTKQYSDVHARKMTNEPDASAGVDSDGKQKAETSGRLF